MYYDGFDSKSPYYYYYYFPKFEFVEILTKIFSVFFLRIFLFVAKVAIIRS
jgi:hypothetical protein